MASGSGTELVTTGSDDGTVKVWEGGEEGGKVPVATFEVGCPVTAVCWGTDGNTIYVGAIDNEVHVRPFLFKNDYEYPYIMDCTGVRPSQRFTILLSYRSHRHTNLSLRVTQWKLSPFAVFLFPDNYLGYSTIFSFTQQDTSCLAGRSCRV